MSADSVLAGLNFDFASMVFDGRAFSDAEVDGRSGVASAPSSVKSQVCGWAPVDLSVARLAETANRAVSCSGDVDPCLNRRNPLQEDRESSLMADA
jgi:hypothetical protein